MICLSKYYGIQTKPCKQQGMYLCTFPISSQEPAILWGRIDSSLKDRGPGVREWHVFNRARMHARNFFSLPGVDTSQYHEEKSMKIKNIGKFSSESFLIYNNPILLCIITLTFTFQRSQISCPTRNARVLSIARRGKVYLPVMFTLIQNLGNTRKNSKG